MSDKIKLIIKKDLAFHMTEEELHQIENMTDTDFVQLRRELLFLIESREFPIDLLEQQLEEIKKEEYLYSLQFVNSDDVSKQAELVEQMDSKCTQMAMNIMAKTATEENLLGLELKELVEESRNNHKK